MRSLTQAPWCRGRLFVAAFALAVGCTATRDSRVLSTFLLHPGAHLGAAAGVRFGPFAIVHKGRTRCAHQVWVDDVEFSVDVSCGTGQIRTVSTRDPKFSTAEGIAIGHEMEAVKKVPGARLLSDEEVQLPSGWVAQAGDSVPPRVVSFTSPEEG